MMLGPTHPHRRYNQLTGEWVLVSPHRMKRPWRGSVESKSPKVIPVYDPDCYLCPGNQRARGKKNSDYKSIFSFTNDFPALLPDAPMDLQTTDPLLTNETVKGTCRVLCYSPRHDLTLSRMSQSALLDVISLWDQQKLDLGQQYSWIQLFENRGAMMGSSLLHPHGQVWAIDTLPHVVAREDYQQKHYFEQHKQPLLIDYEKLESTRHRIVVENSTWLVVVPYWAMWPFETLLLPRRQVSRLPDLDTSERAGLADILKRLLTKYDNLFESSFPYSMGWHGAPFVDEDVSHWQLHAHFYPPLLRSATVRKFMVGYEMLCEAQRDLTPEQAAKRLNALPDIHYQEAVT